MLLLLAAALAQDSDDLVEDSVAECNASVTASFPAPGATEVPLDTQPVLEISTSCPGMATTAVLYTTDSGVAVVREEPELLDYTNVTRLVPPQPLAPATEYSLHVYGDYEGASLIGFTTGNAMVEPFEGTPEILSIDCNLCDGSTGFASIQWFELQVQAVPDPLGGSVLSAYADDEPDVVAGAAMVGSARTLDVVAFTFQDGSPSDECFTVVQTDAAGREVGRSARYCAVSGRPPNCGCASTPPAPLALGVLGLALARRRHPSRSRKG